MFLPSALQQIALLSLAGSEIPWKELNLPKVSHLFHGRVAMNTHTNAGSLKCRNLRTGYAKRLKTTTTPYTVFPISKHASYAQDIIFPL